MISLTGCHRLSKPIREPKPKIADGKISRYAFAASFNGAKLEHKTIKSTEKVLNVYHDYSQNVNAMTRIKEVRFQEEKLNASELTKIFELFRQV